MRLSKITPIAIVCLLGLLYLVYNIFTEGRDKNILAYIILFIIVLALVFAIDRFLVSKFNYKILFVVELILLIVGTVGYFYTNRSTIINVTTNSDHFFVYYDNGGLKLQDIPTKRFFDREITLNADSNLHINYSLEYAAQIDPTKAWNYSFISKKLEAKVGNEVIIVAIYAFKLNEQQVDAVLKQEIARLQKIATNNDDPH